MFSKIPNFSSRAVGCLSESKRLRTVLLIAIVATGILLGHHFSRSVQAANISWNGGGATNNWSEAANWSGGAAPTSSDVAIFNGPGTAPNGNKNVTIDVNINVLGIQINTGYTGTITQAPGAAITIGGSAFSQAAGTFNGSSNTITINSNGFGAFTQTGGTFNGGSGDIHLTGDGNADHDFRLSGGTFTSTSGTLFLSRSFRHDLGGTFVHNSGTVTFDSIQSPSLPLFQVPAGEIFNNLNFSKENGADVSFSGNVIVVGALALNDGSLSGGGTVEARAGVTVASTFDGGNVTLAIANGGGVTRIFTFAAGANLLNVVLNDPDATINTPGSGVLNWRQLILQQGIVNQGGVDFSFFPPSGGGEPFIQSGGTFNGSSNTITFNSNGFGAFTQSGGAFNGGSGDIHLTGDGNANHDFRLSGGTFTSTSGTLFVPRSFRHDSGGTFVHNSGTVTFDSIQSPSTPVIQVSAAGDTFNNLNFSKDDGTSILVTGKLIVVGALALNDGSLSGAVQTLQPQGNMTIASTFDGGNLDVTFAGSANQVFTNNGGANPTGTWTVNKSAGKVTLASDLILGTSQSLNVTSGTLDLGPSFNLRAGSTTIGATGTLRDFGTGDLTLGGNLINNGVFNFNGGGTNCSDPNVANQLLIRSSSSGTTRAWSGSGAFSVVDVDVQDQDATAVSGGITAFGSSTVSNSPNWTANSGCPIIVSQPSNVSACPGSLVTFTVSSSDASATFQWRKNGVNLNNGGNISGATSATLTINPVSAADAASSPGYDAVGTNSFGVTATSNAATLTLLAPPLITSSPTNAIKCEGDSVTFTASATGDGLTFQWRKNTVNISGANSSSFTINPVAPGDAGSYDVVVTGTCTPPVTSNAATLTVNAKPAITTQPSNQTACENGSASFTVAATGTNLTFQWRKNGTPLTNSGHFSGVNTATLTINPVGLSDADSYDVVVSGTCSPSVTSAPRTLTVNAAPAISNQPTNQEVCEGGPASFSVGATGSAAGNKKRSAQMMRIEPFLTSSLTFQWRRNGSPLSNGGHISGADTPTLTINPSTAGDVGSYDVVVSGTCNPAATSNAASLTVDGFSLSASSQTVPLSGGSGSVNVITAAGCSWTAVSNDTFIHITSGSSGTGNGTVNFTVDSSGAPRTGTMTIAGNTFTVNQSGGQVVAPVVISEFRFHGSAGPLDEFVELYNNSDAPADISGYTLFTLTAGGSQTLTFTVPGALASNTTLIPARGHYLIANNSIGGYSLGSIATPDGTYTTDIVDGSGVALFAGATPATGARADSVGFDTRDALFFETSSLTPAGGITTDGEYSFVRRFILASGASQDTGNNANDFVFVSTTAGTFNGRVSLLGAPGPENLLSPITRNALFGVSLIDPLVAAAAAPNRVRDLTADPGNNSTFGTMIIRRRYTNNTASNITRLRFRIIDITTLNSPNVSGGAQQADVRARTSGDTTVTITGGGSVLVRGTTLETPPVQAAAGGSNSTLSAGTITLGAPLAPGATINIQWLLGVQQTGLFRFFVNVEALP